MTSPEVILDLFVRTRLCREPGCRDYIGKLDIERVESPSFWGLYLIQDTMNEALRLEGVNASGGAAHPPFHFDYLDVAEGSANAHAFQHDDFAFIVVTLPMVLRGWHLSRALSHSPRICHLLSPAPDSLDAESLQGLLFQIQLNFLVSHEYTHHVHGHCVDTPGAMAGLWTEFLDDASDGNLKAQAQELDADGYAIYLALAHLLRSNRRDSALAQLGPASASTMEGDVQLLTCFFLSVLAFFCAFWRGGIDMNSVHKFRHPPPRVRIKHAIQVAQMKCGQNDSAPASWFSPERFRGFFGAAAEVIGGTARRDWDAQMSFLRSPDGELYDGQLFEWFEAMRQKRDEPMPGIPLTTKA
jgi:hypothetical protein